MRWRWRTHSAAQLYRLQCGCRSLAGDPLAAHQAGSTCAGQPRGPAAAVKAPGHAVHRLRFLCRAVVEREVARLSTLMQGQSGRLSAMQRISATRRQRPPASLASHSRALAMRAPPARCRHPATLPAAPTWQAGALQPLLALLHLARKQATVCRHLLWRLERQRSALQPPACGRWACEHATLAPSCTFAGHAVLDNPTQGHRCVAAAQRSRQCYATCFSPATAMWCWRRRPAGS